MNESKSLSARETAWALEVSRRAIDHLVDDVVIPQSMYAGRNRERRFRIDDLPCLKFVLENSANWTPLFCRTVFDSWLQNKKRSKGWIRIAANMLFDPVPYRTKIFGRVKKLEEARRAVVSDPEIMGGEKVLNGTRMPVYMVADMRKSGMCAEEIISNYPSLNADLVELAGIYAQTNPRRGRPPKEVSWRVNPPLRTVTVSKARNGTGAS